MSSKVPLSFSTSRAGGVICDRLTKKNAGWARQSINDLTRNQAKLNKRMPIAQLAKLSEPKRKLPGEMADEIIFEQNSLGVVPFPADVRKHQTNGGPRSYFCQKRKRHFTYHISPKAMAELKRQHREFNKTYGVAISRGEYVELLLKYTYYRRTLAVIKHVCAKSDKVYRRCEEHWQKQAA